jgi:hypothetical protein
LILTGTAAIEKDDGDFMKLSRTLSTAALAASLSVFLIAGPSVAQPVSLGGDPGKSPVFTVSAFSGGTLEEVASDAAKASGYETDLTLLEAKSGEVALADLSLLQGATLDAPAMWAATPDYVDLSWGAIAGVSKYWVFKDGAELVTTSDLAIRDTNVKPGQHVSYRIVAAPDVEGADGRTWGVVAVVPANSGKELVEDLSSQVAALATYTTATIQHQTFIPMAKLDAPPAGCTYNYPNQFGGDNRGYLASGFPYRTRLQATVNFSGSGTMTYTRTVGATHAYNSSGTLLGTSTASSSGMTVTKLAGSTATSMSLRFNLDAGNPFCTGIPNSISAVFTLNITNSGSWSITSGVHKQMPNHELYIHSNVGGWVTAYQRTYASAYCLVNGACANANMTGYYGTY